MPNDEVYPPRFIKGKIPTQYRLGWEGGELICQPLRKALLSISSGEQVPQSWTADAGCLRCEKEQHAVRVEDSPNL
jgi:hypothetical protein